MPSVSETDDDREKRLSEALAACLRELESGSDSSSLAAKYPEFAAEVAEFCANHDRVGRLLKPLRSTSCPADPPLPSFGDYEALEVLGRGGMGIVYKAWQRSLNRLVALKMIRAAVLPSPADVQRFRNEAESAAKLDHPNIVRIYEIGEQEGQPYFSMEYVEGMSLAQAMTRTPEPWRSLDHQRYAAELVKTIALAIHHAHQRGLIHRDLKPANILLHMDEGGRMKDESESAPSQLILPKVADFGLAK
jgi:serine/threonine-protein kinase